MAKQLIVNDLLAVMTLRSAESALRHQGDDEDGENLASESRSETGTTTPTSVQGARILSQSPVQPNAKATTS